MEKHYMQDAEITSIIERDGFVAVPTHLLTSITCDMVPRKVYDSYHY